MQGARAIPCFCSQPPVFVPRSSKVAFGLFWSFSALCPEFAPTAHTCSCFCSVAWSIWRFGDPMGCSPSRSPLAHGLLRQEHWSGLPFPSPGIFLEGRLKPASSAVAAGFCTTESPEIIVPYDFFVSCSSRTGLPRGSCNTAAKGPRCQPVLTPLC